MAIKIIRIKPEFEDDRGGIARVVEFDGLEIKSILRITSKKGSIRSNHYHKTDSHYIYIESGKMEYYERPAEDKEAELEKMTLVPGDLVYTAPMVAHAVRFLEDSVIYAYTTETRDQKHYEKDTVRVTLIE